MKMRKQRLMGAALVAIAALVLLLASTGKTDEDRDATAALLVGPLGLYMMFTKEYVLTDRGTAEDDQNERSGAQLPERIFTLHTRTARKESPHGKKTSSRGPEPQDMGGRQRRAPADR